MTAKVNNRRRAPRAPVLLSVQYDTVASTEGAQTVDISRSGLFLGTNNPLPVGTQLELRIGETLRLKVRVARIVEPDAAGERTPGMGCAILEADEATTLALASELARTPPREMKVVVDAPWPAAVPLAPKNTRGSASTTSIKSKSTEPAHSARGNGSAGDLAASGERRGKKDKKRQKGQRADLFADKPE